ncbi:uncharacterized protein LOC119996937 [Tripterygium wilfordii]|uniref:uncharacterized protein LOC119996937 n=1 Tax=Tripterygium wilfordii TaxID=458696 RepID=UPI0018F83403|nr:uncharacterized protein LOC119996937 [Tripterygium wilfordii]
MGIQAAVDVGVKKLQVYGDSQLVIRQLCDEWETRDAKLVPYYQHIKELMKFFDCVEFDHIPREENQMADALATLAAMFDLDLRGEVEVIRIEKRKIQAHCLNIVAEPDGKPWYYDVKQYLEKGEYPPEASDNDKRTIRRLSSSFFLDKDVLYKRSSGFVLLRCVDTDGAKQIMEDIHEGICGTHAGGYSMARKILRAGYYWLTMERDCINYAIRCHKCQIYADKTHVPVNPLRVLAAPWPFSMWGIDVIGPIEPKASNGHRFILVAIDYFTKWVEANSYAKVTSNVIARFLRKDIVCRYGVPERIITDNGTNFNSKIVNDLCEQFKIKHHNSSPYRPKMNGAVEAANKNIKKIIQKMTENYKDWHEKLPFALYGYRTSVRTSTGESPFALVYGTEAVLPIEVEITEWVRARYEHLNFIEGRRLGALCRGQLYQRRMIRAHHKRVRPRCFRGGDLVLKMIQPPQRDHRGKWTPTYEGPYVVKKAFSGGAVILTKMDGDDLPHPVNADVLRRTQFQEQAPPGLAQFWEAQSNEARNNFGKIYGRIGHLLTVKTPAYGFRSREVCNSRRADGFCPCSVWSSVISLCGNYNWVPLVGPWGGTSQAPAMFLRQEAGNLCTPITHGLWEFEFAHGDEKAKRMSYQVLEAWKRTHIMERGRLTADPEGKYRYVQWLRGRKKTITQCHSFVSMKKKETIPGGNENSGLEIPSNELDEGVDTLIAEEVEIAQNSWREKYNRYKNKCKKLKKKVQGEREAREVEKGQFDTLKEKISKLQKKMKKRKEKDAAKHCRTQAELQEMQEHIQRLNEELASRKEDAYQMYVDREEQRRIEAEKNRLIDQMNEMLEENQQQMEGITTLREQNDYFHSMLEEVQQEQTSTKFKVRLMMSRLMTLSEWAEVYERRLQKLSSNPILEMPELTQIWAFLKNLKSDLQELQRRLNAIQAGGAVMVEIPVVQVD